MIFSKQNAILLLVGVRFCCSDRIHISGGFTATRAHDSPIYSSAGSQDPHGNSRGKVPGQWVQTLVLRQQLPGPLDHPYRGCSPRPRQRRKWLDTASHRRIRTVHLSSLYRKRRPPIYGPFAGQGCHPKGTGHSQGYGRGRSPPGPDQCDAAHRGARGRSADGSHRHPPFQAHARSDSG